MRRNKILYAGLFIVLTLIFSGLSVAAEENVTIVGTVNDSYQVVTDDDQVYEIGENEKGDALAELVGEKVKVTGKVFKEDEQKVIMVLSYETVEE